MSGYRRHWPERFLPSTGFQVDSEMTRGLRESPHPIIKSDCAAHFMLGLPTKVLCLGMSDENVGFSGLASVV